eukprot:COSAG02_NODE_1743_length_11100_cov_17.677575_10_plen_158_part_00
MIGCKYRCVAPKAYATEEIAPTPVAGLEVSVVEKNSVITCLDARMAASKGNEGQRLRLRCEAGWVSYVAANGNQLFELETAPDGSVPHSTAMKYQTKGSKSDVGKGGKKAQKKERREQKAAAKAARRAVARREHNLLWLAIRRHHYPVSIAVAGGGI